MKIIKGGLLLAALSVVALTFSSSAVANPIGAGRAFTGRGSINLDGGLGGSNCTAFSIAGTGVGSINSATFAGCTGAAGTPTALASVRTPWAITWNARLDGGTITVTALANVAGVALCLYQGAVNFTYNTGTRVVTILRTAVPLFQFLGGSNICPADVRTTGSITLAF